jgi:23S rRNA pseudouridine1911/1915/1917 synthase
MVKTGHVMQITAELAGRTLADVVRKLREGTSWNEARELCRRGKVKRNGALATDAAQRVAEGDRIEVNPNAARLRANVLDASLLVHLDRDVVVVNKPVGLLSVPFEDDDKNTLIDRVRLLLRRKTGQQDVELGAVQRLDKDTSGLIVFTLNLPSKRKLQQLFRVHDIERRYLAIAHGDVQAGDCESWLLTDRGDGLRGSHGVFRRASGAAPKDAQRALTHLAPLESLAGATLVECRLETGRQHQIRIHLSERGHPLLGEAVYVRDYHGKVIDAPRPMLHAQTLGFAHPRTGERLSFEQAPPPDFENMLSALRTR